MGITIQGACTDASDIDREGSKYRHPEDWKDVKRSIDQDKRRAGRRETDLGSMVPRAGEESEATRRGFAPGIPGSRFASKLRRDVRLARAKLPDAKVVVLHRTWTLLHPRGPVAVNRSVWFSRGVRSPGWDRGQPNVHRCWTREDVLAWEDVRSDTTSGFGAWRGPAAPRKEDVADRNRSWRR